MTTKNLATIAATRQKILAQISLAKKQADLAKNAAKTAKAGLKLAKQKLKAAKRTAKIAKKAVKALKNALTATMETKTPIKPAATKPALKLSRSTSAVKVAREPVVTVAATSVSVPPMISMV